jgi:nicotinate-nucleotide adenylyltransferase
MRIGVLGGSFDPVHNAHLIVAQLAREQLGLDQVRLIVARQQPLKSAGHHASGEHRMRMVELAVAGISGLIADDRELLRSGPSYTADTFADLAEESPGAELVLLMGADVAQSFSRWHRPDRIQALSRIAVYHRQGAAVPDGFDIAVEVPNLELSSTAIRARAANGLPLAGWVPQQVADYIVASMLYRRSAG